MKWIRINVVYLLALLWQHVMSPLAHGPMFFPAFNMQYLLKIKIDIEIEIPLRKK